MKKSLAAKKYQGSRYTDLYNLHDKDMIDEDKKGTKLSYYKDGVITNSLLNYHRKGISLMSQVEPSNALSLSILGGWSTNTNLIDKARHYGGVLVRNYTIPILTETLKTRVAKDKVYRRYKASLITFWSFSRSIGGIK